MNYKVESGRRLKAKRTRLNLTLDELSKKVGGGLSASRLSNYEQGLRQIGIAEALALYKHLGVTAAHLLCVDVADEEGEMTAQELELLRNFRALPEKDRVDYFRRIAALSLIYREPVADERLSPIVRRGAPRSKPRKRNNPTT